MIVGGCRWVSSGTLLGLLEELGVDEEDAEAGLKSVMGIGLGSGTFEC